MVGGSGRRGGRCQREGRGGDERCDSHGENGAQAAHFRPACVHANSPSAAPGVSCGRDLRCLSDPIPGLRSVKGAGRSTDRAGLSARPGLPRQRRARGQPESLSQLLEDLRVGVLRKTRRGEVDLAEIGIEGLLVGLADRAPRRGDQLGHVVNHRLVDTGTRVLEGQVTVAFMGEQDGVAEVLLGSHGVAIGRVGVIARVDQQDRVRGRGVPGAAVVVLAAHRRGGTGGPPPPALRATLESADPDGVV